MEIMVGEAAPGLATGIKRRRLETTQDPKPKTPETPLFWSTEEIGYFYPDYNASTNHFKVKESEMLHTLVFFNAEAFISQLRGILVFKSAEIIKENIHSCLRDDALDWYNTELSDAERKDLRDLPLEHKNGWFNQILSRFRLSHNTAISYLASPDSGNTICATARNIVRYAQAAGIDDKHQQMLRIWGYLETHHPFHARRLSRPSQDTSLSEFMRNLYVVEQDVLITPDHDLDDNLKDHESDESSENDELRWEPPIDFKGCDNCDCKWCERTRL